MRSLTLNHVINCIDHRSDTQNKQEKDIQNTQPNNPFEIVPPIRGIFDEGKDKYGRKELQLDGDRK